MTLRVAFPLGTFADVTVLSEKQSLLALLSSIVGLGGVFSLFGSLLAMVDEAASAHARRRGRVLAALSGHGAAPAKAKTPSLLATLYAVLGSAGKRPSALSSGPLMSSATAPEEAGVVTAQNPLGVVCGDDDGAATAPRCSDELDTWR